MVETKQYGLLMAMMEPPEEMEEEFNNWYDTEHIPERKAVAGILTAQRFVAYEGSPKYLALYDLESIEVLQGEAYRRIGPGHYSPWTQRINRHARIFIRQLYKQTFPGPALISKDTNAITLWAHEIPEGKEKEFNRWYEKECMSYLNKIEGFIHARRFNSVEGGAKDLVLLEFRDLEFLQTEIYNRVLFSEESIKNRRLFRETVNKVYTRYNLNLA